MFYDIVIIGAGPGGLYAAYELCKKYRVAIIDSGHLLDKRNCPSKNCIHCSTCSIMKGFGGAGAFSDGKFNITNDFGGTLWSKIGYEEALGLMKEVDAINCSFGANSKLYDSTNSNLHKICLQNNLKLQNATIRHLGTDVNFKLLKELYFHLNDKVDKFCDTTVTLIKHDSNYTVYTNQEVFTCDKCVVAVGRSGYSLVSTICKDLDISTKANKADIGVRVEIPYEIFSHITEELYESKILYTTKTYEDKVRTFCMNPHGIVVNENTNGIITVNGHSYEDPRKFTNNTNFALLVGKTFTEPFNDSVAYCESIVKLSNMLGGGVIIQRFGDLIRGRRSTENRLRESIVRPTLDATPGDLSLVLPKRILDDIIETIYVLDKIAPGMSNDDTLLYGVETKFYNTEVEVDNNLETRHKGLFIIGDGSGITHSLSQAAASGLYVGRYLNATN